MGNKSKGGGIQGSEWGGLSIQGVGGIQAGGDFCTGGGNTSKGGGAFSTLWGSDLRKGGVAFSIRGGAI